MRTTTTLRRTLRWFPAAVLWLVLCGSSFGQIDPQRPWAYFSTKPDEVEAQANAPQINLRPNVTESLYLYVTQPGAETPTLDIEVLAGTKAIAKFSGKLAEAKKFQRVKLTAVPLPALPPTSDGRPAPTPLAGVSLPFIPTIGSVPGHLQLKISVVEQGVAGARPNVASQAVIIDDPADVLSKAEVKVLGGGGEKKLEVNLEAKDLRAGPMDVKMSFATDNPNELDTTGFNSQLEGRLTAENPRLQLFARNFKTTGQARGTVTLKLDNIDRAAVFVGTFDVQAEGTRIFDRLSNPAVKINAPRFAKPGADVPVAINVTKMPANAPLTFEVMHRGGRERGQRETRPTSCQYEASAKGDDGTGTLNINSIRKPWEIKLNTAGVTGACTLTASVTENELEIGKDTTRIVFDDSAPRISAFGLADQKQQLVKGRTAVLRVTGKDDESGVAKVEFWAGAEPPPADAKDPPAVKPINGVADPKNPGSWVAKVNLPEKPGAFPVYVRLTNGIGMTSGVRPLTLAVIDIPLGSIKGQLTFDKKTQLSNIQVWLLDEKYATVKGPVGVDKDGVYEFTNVKPGVYRLATMQKVSGRPRIGQTEVTVPEGDLVTEANIKLKVR